MSEIGKCGKRLQISGYRINKSCSLVTVVNRTTLYI